VKTLRFTLSLQVSLRIRHAGVVYGGLWGVSQTLTFLAMYTGRGVDSGRVTGTHLRFSKIVTNDSPNLAVCVYFVVGVKF